MHVIPLGDLIKHEATQECVCGPRLRIQEFDDGQFGWVIIHPSLDGREQRLREIE